MRRLAELLKTGFYSSERLAGMRLATISLLAFTLFTFSALAHAQVVSSDFEDGTMQGWVQNGSPTTLEVSTDMAHSGTHSLKIVKSPTGQGYDGASMDLRPIMNASEYWEFQVWVRLAPGMPDDTIYLQLRDPTTDVWGGYPPATAQLNVTDKEWVLLKGRYPDLGKPAYPGGASELKLYFNTNKGSTSFYADDFVAYKIQPSGCSNPEDTTGVQTGFETGTEGWMPRPWSGVYLYSSYDTAHSGSRSLLTFNRNGSWTVSAYDISGKICNGSQYRVSAWVKLKAGSPDATFTLTGETSKDGATTNPVLVPSKTVTANEWTEFKANLDMKLDYDRYLLFLQPDTDGSSEYYIDDFSVTYVPAGQAVEPIPSIGQAYKTYFPVGAAVYGPDVDLADLHSDLLTLHFTSVTPENDMKWTATEPAENQFDYSKADAIVTFAKSHSMAVRGHALVWHQQTPDWVFQDAQGVDMSTLPYSDANRDLLYSRMKKHIQALIAHFGADVSAWDVVNEPFDESVDGVNGYRNSKWYKIAGGPGYIDEAFKYAKEAVDNAGLTGKVKLYLNEYNTNIPGKLNAMKAYLSASKTSGVPIDGVGHQFHYKLDWPVNDDPTSIKAVTDTIDAVAALGFDNQITEMDLSVYRSNPSTTYQSYADVIANLQNDLVVQGYRYRDYFSAFKTLATAGKLSSVTLWGMADDHTWLTTASKADAPLPFDRNFTHKPAYTGIMDATSLPNALPFAADAEVKVSFDTPILITLPASDANLDTLTYTITNGPTNGTLSAVAGNKVTYTPTAGYFGPDTISYTANDGNGDSNVGQINITVLPAPPVAQDQTVHASTNTPKAITLVATGDGTMTYAVVTQPAHGTLSGTAPDLTYTPATDYAGPDSFTFKANNSLDSNIATVTINVVLEAPVAADQSVTTDFNTAKDITLSAAGYGTVTYSVVAQPAHGTLTGTAPALTYTPAKDYWGADSFTFKANNGNDSNVGTVSITVLPALPVAKEQSVTVDYGTPTRITVTATGNGTMKYSIVTPPKEGTVTQTVEGDTTTWTYTTLATLDPRFENSSASPTDKFTFKANNGHDSAPATVTITINPATLKLQAADGEQTTKTVTAGGSTTFNLQVAGYGSWRQWSTPEVSFVCGGLPNYASCTVTPNQVTLPAAELPESTPVAFSVTIRTNTGTGAVAGSTSMPGSWPGMPWIAGALAMFALALITTRRAKVQWRFAGAFAVLLLVASLPGCGGNATTTKTGGDMLTTPKGTYNVVVTAVGTRNLSGQSKSDWKIVGEIPLKLTVN